MTGITIIMFGMFFVLLGCMAHQLMIGRNLALDAYGSAVLRMLGLVASSIAIGIVLCGWMVHPSPFFPFALATAPIVILIAFARPFLVCLMFVAFAFFRIHELFPILLPLSLPEFLALLSLLALAWNFFVSRSLIPYAAPELGVFLVFFAIVTIGVFFAYDPQLSLEKFSDVFWKFGIMTLAFAWLVRTPEDFVLAGRTWMFCGLLVSVIALGNKVAGIDLVEGSRVTIGTGNLGDPNDLALVLLFPLSFSTAALLYREKVFDTFLALLTTFAIIGAIIATQSRGGLLGVLAVLSVVGSRWIRAKSVLFLLIIIAAVGLFIAADIGERFDTGGPAAAPSVLDESASSRLEIWTEAVEVAIARPLLGVGIANFTGPDGLTAHSIWFEVLAETGFPGLLVFATLIIVLWRGITFSIGKLDELGAATSVHGMALALQAALLGFCVSGSFLTMAFTWPLYIYVALIAAVGEYTRRGLRAREGSAQDPHCPRNLGIDDARILRLEARNQ